MPRAAASTVLLWSYRLGQATGRARQSVRARLVQVPRQRHPILEKVFPPAAILFGMWMCGALVAAVVASMAMLWYSPGFLLVMIPSTYGLWPLFAAKWEREDDIWKLGCIGMVLLLGEAAWPVVAAIRYWNHPSPPGPAELALPAALLAIPFVWLLTGAILWNFVRGRAQARVLPGGGRPGDPGHDGPSGSPVPRPPSGAPPVLAAALPIPCER